RYCVQSIYKFATGFRKIWIISPAELGADRFAYGSGGGRQIEWKVLNEECEDHYLSQQIHKLYADVITDYQADYILHIDSDTVFTQPVAPESFFSLRDDGLPQIIWPYTPYKAIETPWQPITEKFMQEPVENEFMRRFPIMIPRWLYSRIRTFCFYNHGMIL